MENMNVPTTKLSRSTNVSGLFENLTSQHNRIKDETNTEILETCRGEDDDDEEYNVDIDRVADDDSRSLII